MAPRMWWSCSCGGGGGATQLQLQLREIPSSALSPLFFDCASCAARLVPCESCHVLLDASRAQADGSLLCCRRCGALSVLDASLRALLAIGPVSRLLLKRVPFVIEPLGALRERIRECDARLQRLRRPAGEREEPGGGLAITQPPTQQRKRRRPGDPQTSAAATAPDSPLSSLEAEVAALEAEEETLQRQLRDEMRRWEQFAAETTDPSALLLRQQQQQQQTFSTTHLNILRVMYEASAAELEFADLVHRIEQFLTHQSTLLKTKFDVLAAVESCREAEQLHALAPLEPGHERRSCSATVSMAQVTNTVVNSTKEQLRHRYESFQALSRPHLALVGDANVHLFALYSAAQSLQSSQVGHAAEREPLVIQRELFGTTGGRVSASDEQDAGRSRRRYSSGSVSATVFGEHNRLRGGGLETFSHVQQSLERGNRIAAISKKVELWRALSATISAACVLSEMELAAVAESPLA